MKKQIALLLAILAVTVSAKSEAYFRFLVVHGQTASVPACPAGFTPMWSGYSLAGSWLNSNLGSPQDLSDPGSCAEQFIPLQALSCSATDCVYGNGSDRSIYLINKDNLTPGAIAAANSTQVASAATRISRCEVCYGKKPVVTKHSYTNTTPSCPTGWSSLWTGYSFGGASQNSGRDAGQTLAETGSCLKNFVPNPITWCDADNCTYRAPGTITNYTGYDPSNPASMWLLNFNTVTDTSHKTDMTQNLDRISRCNVCVKD